MTKAAIAKTGECIIDGNLIPASEAAVLRALSKQDGPAKAQPIADITIPPMRVENVRTYLSRLRLRGLVHFTQRPGTTPMWVAAEPVKQFFRVVEEEERQK